MEVQEKMSRFLRFFRIIAIAFLCVVGVHFAALAGRCSSSNEGSFEIQTIDLTGTDKKVEFYIGAEGYFSVDWGDGNVTPRRRIEINQGGGLF